MTSNNGTCRDARSKTPTTAWIRAERFNNPGSPLDEGAPMTVATWAPALPTTGRLAPAGIAARTDSRILAQGPNGGDNSSLGHAAHPPGRGRSLIARSEPWPPWSCRCPPRRSGPRPRPGLRRRPRAFRCARRAANSVQRIAERVLLTTRRLCPPCSHSPPAGAGGAQGDLRRAVPRHRRVSPAPFRYRATGPGGARVGQVGAERSRSVQPVRDTPWPLWTASSGGYQPAHHWTVRRPAAAAARTSPPTRAISAARISHDRHRRRSSAPNTSQTPLTTILPAPVLSVNAAWPRRSAGRPASW